LNKQDIIKFESVINSLSVGKIYKTLKKKTFNIFNNI